MDIKLPHYCFATRYHSGSAKFTIYAKRLAATGDGKLLFDFSRDSIVPQLLQRSVRLVREQKERREERAGQPAREKVANVRGAGKAHNKAVGGPTKPGARAPPFPGSHRLT